MRVRATCDYANFIASKWHEAQKLLSKLEEIASRKMGTPKMSKCEGLIPLILRGLLICDDNKKKHDNKLTWSSLQTDVAED